MPEYIIKIETVKVHDIDDVLCMLNSAISVAENEGLMNEGFSQQYEGEDIRVSAYGPMEW